MLFSVEQAFVGRDEKRGPLKTPVWEAKILIAYDYDKVVCFNRNPYDWTPECQRYC